MRDTGTATSIARWFNTIRAVDGSSIELHAIDVSGSQLVTGWAIEEASAESAKWGSLVSDLATDDATSRGQTTRYELRHKTPEGIRGVTHLRRIIKTTDDPTDIDGSQLGLVAQLQRALHQSHAQLLDASRAAIQAQQASMVLLGQAYGHIATLQQTSSDMHRKTIEDAPSNMKPDMVRTMLETVGPHVAMEVVNRMLAPGSVPKVPS